MVRTFSIGTTLKNAETMAVLCFTCDFSVSFIFAHNGFINRSKCINYPHVVGHKSIALPFLVFFIGKPKQTQD